MLYYSNMLSDYKASENNYGIVAIKYNIKILQNKNSSHYNVI